MTTVIMIQGAGEGAHDEDALLAESLRRHLGAAFTVVFPRMPDEDDPDTARWGAVIDETVDRAGSPLVLVGHSAGGFVLIEHLAGQRLTAEVAAICLIAAPFPGADPAWTFEGFDLPENLAERLPEAPVFLYASADDEIVPFAHRARYASALPRAVERTTTGGHQLGGDLSAVAADIRDAVGG